MAFILGGWMLYSGIRVYQKGKYPGPQIPGQWTYFFKYFGIKPLKLGWLFILFGALWLILATAYFFHIPCVWNCAIIIASLSLWYVPIGTVISILSLLILLFFKQFLF
jgi:hypothetical protein